MPILELKQKIEFNVDQTTIDRVEALAALNGLTLDAWFRRLVDDLIAQGSRHMGIDHVEVEEVRKPVFEIIQWLANQIHPLRQKARNFLDKLTFSISLKEAEADLEKPEKKSLIAKLKGAVSKEEDKDIEVEAEIEIDMEWLDKHPLAIAIRKVKRQSTEWIASKIKDKIDEDIMLDVAEALEMVAQELLQENNIE